MFDHACVPMRMCVNIIEVCCLGVPSPGLVGGFHDTVGRMGNGLLRDRRRSAVRVHAWPVAGLIHAEGCDFTQVESIKNDTYIFKNINYADEPVTLTRLKRMSQHKGFRRQPSYTPVLL